MALNQLFAFGGSCDDVSLTAGGAAVCMRIRGPVAPSIHDLPDGAQVQLAGNGLPLQISQFGAPRTTGGYHTAGGQWDAVYSIWFGPTPNLARQNHGTEIMIWGDHAGAPQPAGQKVGATWDVWSGRLCGDGCWNVNSFVRQETTEALDLSIKDFTNDSVARGITHPSWYLTSVQFGFEPWQGDPGLGVDSFSCKS